MVLSSTEIADIDSRFRPHAPSTEEQRDNHALVYGLLGNVAMNLAEFVPSSREKSLMLTHLEEAMFWANAALARKGGS